MIFIALGANLPSRYGSPEDTLRAAELELTRCGIRVVAASSIWKSAPVPLSDQPWYRNSVVCVETDMNVQGVLQALKGIEQSFGRVEAARNAPRVLDLDVIAYYDEIYEGDSLMVPHPRMQGRGFVLYPLQELAPQWRHPVLQQSIDALILGLPSDQRIEKIEKDAA